MIQFLQNTANAHIPAEYHGEHTLVVYRDGYALPNVPGATFVEFQKFKLGYINYQPTHLIMVGTNRIFVPSVRTELVFEHLQTMTPQVKKMSIDTAPFIGEPWRLWFHFSLVYGQWLGVNYSYAVETDWQHWFLQDRHDSIISAASIKPCLQGVTSDLPELTTSFEFYFPEVELGDFYREVKAHAFEKHDTPKMIIATMLRELNRRLDVSFDVDSFTTNQHYRLPAFGIYSFIANECQRRMAIYNTAIILKK